MNTVSLLQDVSERIAINTNFETFFLELIKAGVEKCGGVDQLKAKISDHEESGAFNHLDSLTMRTLINRVSLDDLN